MKTKSKAPEAPAVLKRQAFHDFVNEKREARLRIAAVNRAYEKETLDYANAAQAPIASSAGETLYLANESVFTQQYFDEPLTNYAIGWKDPHDIEATLDFLAPPVPTPRRFTYKSWVNIEEFLSENTYDDLRAIGAEFPTVLYTGSEIHARTDNRGLRIRVDLDEVADVNSPLAGGLPAYQAKIVEKLKRRILRNSLRRACALITAGATNNNKTWSTGTVDPDMDVVNQFVTATTSSGIRPNRVLYGDTAFAKRLTGFRLLNNAGAYASSGLTPEQIGMFLGGTEVRVSRERYSALGAAMAEVVYNLVYMIYNQDGVDTEDPSNVKRFYSMTDSGGPWRVYVQQVTSKLVDITVEHYELISVVSTLGLNQFTIS